MKTNKQTTNLSASAIMQRLPLLRQLTASQNALIKCSPLWEKWVQLHLNNKIAESSLLSHYQNGELIIHCLNAISATQIKLHQQSLLDFLQNNGIDEIKHVTVRIANNPNLFQNKSSTQSEHNQQSKNTTISDQPNSSEHQAFKALDDKTLNSIKVAQKTTKNTVIAESLSRLIQTIEKNNRIN